VKWYWLDPDDMHTAYVNADITLVPTLYSEGTSLSCLEAMASGNAVIATRIGGLPDMIIHNYNGLLIDPNARSLKSAIEQLLDDPEQLAALKRKSREVARAFSKTGWVAEWQNIIQEKMASGVPNQRTRNDLVEIYLSKNDSIKKIGTLVREWLEKGALIYIYRKGSIDHETLSFGRIQFLAWGSERLSNADYVIVDQEAVQEVSSMIGKIDLII